MTKIKVIMLVMMLVLLTGCIEGMNQMTPEAENMTEAPDYEGTNLSNLDNVESIDNINGPYGWTNININETIEYHNKFIENTSNISSSIHFFVQSGGVQLNLESHVKTDFEERRFWMKSDSLVSRYERYGVNDRIFSKRWFSNNSSGTGVYSVENTSIEEYKNRTLSDEDLRTFVQSVNFEMAGRDNNSYYYDVYNINEGFAGFNASEIDESKGFLKVNENGIIEEVEVHIDLNGPPVEVKNGTYLDRQVYFNMNIYDINETHIEEPDWYDKLREEYGDTKYFNEEGTIA
jgi:hypothetical protein